MSDARDTPSSLWWADTMPSLPGFEGELDCDVLIVGGGVAGVTLAFTLAAQGQAVGLLDSGPIAGSASGRNGGFLTVSRPEPYAELIALWGRDGARAMLQTGRRSHRRVRELVESLHLDCDYRTNGSLRLARTAEEAEDLRASLADLESDGFPMREIPLSQAVPGAAQDKFSAAFLTREDGEIHPVRFLYGLALAASERGARLFVNSPLLGARWSGGLWEARTERGVLRARTLVLCTNAFAPALCPALGALIAPRRGQMIATAPLLREVAPRPTLAHWGYQYWRQTPDGRLVIGGWRDLDFDGETGFDDRPTAKIQDAIEGGLRELVPEGVAIERRWAGTMGFARDGRPLVGWLDASHHLAICAGFTGHGMGIAAACTLDLAEVLSFKRAPGIASCDPGRFAELKQVREGVTALGVAAQ